MKAFLTATVGRFLLASRLACLPVRVRSGIAAGAKWTLYPWSTYWRGNQEPVIHDALRDLGDVRGWTCWDLGAHYGIYSVGLARHVGPTGSVVAFEPNPVSYKRLERHRRMNRLTWLKTFAAAVSDQAGTAEFYTYGHLESTTTHLPYDGEASVPPQHFIRVPTIKLDDLVAAGEIRLPNFIKVDVEGHAHHALRGARQSLAQSRPIMIVGLHSESEIRGVMEVIEPLRYDITVLGEPSDTPLGSGHDVLLKPRS